MRRTIGLLLIVGGLAAGFAGVALATPGIGGTSVLIAQGQAAEGTQARIPGGKDVVMVQNTFIPGGSTGWHTHPGLTVIVVQSGEITLNREAVGGGACRIHTYHAGQVFYERPAIAQNAVNHGSTNAVVGVTFFNVAHGGSSRIDQPDPGDCGA
jgi:quercetin dioxygenase-like cupin family protein